MKFNNICCIGGDLVGRTMCIAIAFKCPEIRVIVLDDEKNVAEQNSDTVPFLGPDFHEILKKCRHRNLFFSSFYESAIKEADLIFLSVNVPIRNLMERKQVIVDFKELEEATKLIALYSESDKILVEKSDIPVKAVEKISWILKSTSKTGFQFHILSIPPYINEHSSVDEILYPERIVIGCQCNPSGRSAAQALCEIYEYWVPKNNILVLSHWSAGLYKMISNSFLSQKRCSLNAITAIIEETGADLSTIINVLGKDSSIGPKCLTPSVELETLQEDISNLVFTCKLLNLPEAVDYWQSLLELNEFFLERFLERIKTVLGAVQGQLMTVWGLGENSTIRHKSSAVAICKWLLAENCNLGIHDPELKPHQIYRELGFRNVDEGKGKIEIYRDVYLSIHDSSALLIFSKRQEFVGLDYSKIEKWMKRPLIIDNCRLYEGENLQKHGIQYFTIGSTIEDNIPDEF